jgi:hypothetical protein
MSLNLEDPCFLICGLDCFYTGNAKNYGSCPLDKILSSGYLANPCLCFWTTNFIHWLAVHWISSCPVDNLIQWITLSSILNNQVLASRSCYSNITLLKFYDWSVGGNNIIQNNVFVNYTNNVPNPCNSRPPNATGPIISEINYSRSSHQMTHWWWGQIHYDRRWVKGRERMISRGLPKMSGGQRKYDQSW